jgi:hypothetical protein
MLPIMTTISCACIFLTELVIIKSITKIGRYVLQNRTVKNLCRLDRGKAHFSEIFLTYTFVIMTISII